MLGIKPWSRQADILRAVCAHRRVAVRSGHKCGKSTAVAILCLWWVCTRPRARVVFTAASARQVRSILWKEIRRLYHGARWPIGGEMHEGPENGLQFKDGREIVGFSTDDPERMAGFSGPNMLFVVDEASGVPDAIFEAIEGNRAGGARVVMISNPTQTSGVFYEAFHGTFWFLIHVSSEEAADECVEGLGLATRDWVDEKRAEWGEDDPRFAVRVRGDFPMQGDDCMVPLALVEAAMAREPNPVGEACLGVDVARYGTDSSVIAPAVGMTVLPLRTVKGFDVVEVAGVVLEEAEKLGATRGIKVTVRVDTASMGAGVADIVRRAEGFCLEVVDVFASSSSTDPSYSRQRDQIWASLVAFLRQGGVLPADETLRSDIVAPKYGFDVQGKIKVESKVELRKRIGRSTDRADAVGLAVFRAEGVSNAEQVLSDRYEDEEHRWSQESHSESW